MDLCDLSIMRRRAKIHSVIDEFVALAENEKADLASVKMVVMSWDGICPKALGAGHSRRP